MRCPMTYRSMYTTGPGIQLLGAECIKEKCAWWNKTMEECNLVTIAVGLFDISIALDKIQREMPQWRQFGK